MSQFVCLAVRVGGGLFLLKIAYEPSISCLLYLKFAIFQCITKNSLLYSNHLSLVHPPSVQPPGTTAILGALSLSGSRRNHTTRVLPPRPAVPAHFPQRSQCLRCRSMSWHVMLLSSILGLSDLCLLCYRSSTPVHSLVGPIHGNGYKTPIKVTNIFTVIMIII